ncbi:MAG: hypothetical protein LW875_05695 [Proteobacteria bacterium]|jgi:UDP-N-acetylglucosamine acyltransferase|nr:hypothetical protein [Pseudomonadota bacterium]
MSNSIHPTCVIDPKAKIGTGNHFGPYCVVGPDVVIGNNNRFEAMVCIGLAPQHKSFWLGKYKGVKIGDNNIIRERVSIDAGTTQDTVIGNGVSLLIGVYVSHDTIIENDATLSNNVMVGGHSIIFKGANLGFGVMVHQYSRIGHFSMIGMGTVVTKSSKILPCRTYVGAPARELKMNAYAIKRNNLSASQIEDLEKTFSSTSAHSVA